MRTGTHTEVQVTPRSSAVGIQGKPERSTARSYLESQPVETMRQAAVLLVVLFGGSCASVAQEASEGRTPVWQFGAYASVSATDNARVSTADRQTGVGTEVGVDVHLNLPYRRFRGFADYSLAGAVSHTDGVAYSRRTGLHAGLNAEVVESNAFLDVSATYGTQLGSVFESPERSLLIQNDNRVETGNITVSPSLRWRLGDSGRAEARLVDSTTKVRGSSAGDAHSQAGTLRVDGGVQPKSLAWKGSAYGAIYDSDNGPRVTEAFVRGDVGWAFDGSTVVSLIGGREGNDFASPRRIYNYLYGVSLDYRPSEQTGLSAEVLNRFFGTGHTLSLRHQIDRFALIASSSRSNSRPGGGFGDATELIRGSAYEVLYLQLRAVEPDPDRRRLLVLDLLTTNGIDPTQSVVPWLITSGVVLEASHSVSASWSGVRNRMALTISQGNSRRLGSEVLLPLGDSFRTEDSISQRGIQVVWLRRMTPTDDVAVTHGRTRSEGQLTQLTSTSHTTVIGFSRRVAAHSSLSIRLSHTSFDSLSSPGYRVNSASCEYRVRF
jgi:uncharacterized protein (PEP-CTERM system associated)